MGGERRVASPSQTIGPFFHVGPASTERLGQMAFAETAGERIRLRVRVLDGDGAPVTDALVELWQAGADGRYRRPSDRGAGFTGFGRLGTDEHGWCRFETIRPGALPADEGARQAAHVNVCLFARGLLRHLYTRIYFEGDPDLGQDPLLSLVAHDRRDTLLARRSADGEAWEFVVRLQGERETVFFDV
jgi:protocatechuate 3,4-dioxygenase alpha subunit